MSRNLTSAKLRSLPARLGMIAVAAATLFACFLASDHCLLAAFSTSLPATECCEHEGATNKQPADSAGSKMLCCDVVQGIPTTTAKAPVTDFTLLKTILFAEISHLILAHSEANIIVSILSYESPPPGASFAVLFSSRDLLAHAPPVFVS
ncbi:MAG: hypothetical protein ACK5NG_04485 [Chthoniobacterales bacterium]